MEVEMSLSRKRRKELKRLRSNAEELWGNQQQVLAHANSVAREASRQLGHVTREEVVPRMRSGYESYVRPGMDSARDYARSAGDAAQQGLGNALGSLLAIGDIANDARVRRAVERVSPRAAAVVQQKKGPGVGTYLAIGAGIVAAVGVAYAVWQTFRADDELWVADDEPGSSAGGTPAASTRSSTKGPSLSDQGGPFVVLESAELRAGTDFRADSDESGKSPCVPLENPASVNSRSWQHETGEELIPDDAHHFVHGAAHGSPPRLPGLLARTDTRRLGA
jgi:hypothetical protein